MTTQMQVTPLGDRVTTKRYHDGKQWVEDVTLETIQRQSLALEAQGGINDAYARVRADRQKNWPSGGK